MANRRWCRSLWALALFGCTPTGGEPRERGSSEREPSPPESPPADPSPPKSLVPARHRLALGQYHSCVIRDGVVYCWGANDKGQLGDRSEVDRPQPVTVSGIVDAVSIVAGSEHTCALRADGSVWCWGNDDQGQVSGRPGGTHSQPVRQPLDQLNQVKAIAARGARTCAVDGRAQVRCWGALAGDGRRLELESLTAVDVSVGAHIVCALTVDGHVDCRGPNFHGDLGVLDGTLLASRVEGIDDADALSVGDVHACVHRSDDTIACWGAGFVGQTGTLFASETPSSQTNTTVAINRPRLAELPAIAQVSAGFHHTCVVARDGRVGCFGSNSEGQSRPDEQTKRVAEVDWLDEPSDVVEVAAGFLHSCALRANGEVWCWGDDSRAQLGGGIASAVERAVGLTQVDGDATTFALDGRSGTACTRAIGERGDEPWCQADGPWMVGDERVVEFAGDCVRLESGRVVCEGVELELGDLAVERLGAGDQCFVLVGGGLGCVDVDRLVRVLDSGVTRVAVGRDVTCIADQAGAPSCWTDQRGRTHPPTDLEKVADVLDVEQLVVAWFSACALTRSGAVECWSLEGDDAWKATTMPGIPPATAIAGMDRHVCAITREGQVWCWGRNDEGELGDGTTDDREHPVQVEGIPPVVAVAGRDRFTCARTRDEQLWCWGEHPFAHHGYEAITRVVGLPRAR